MSLLNCWQVASIGELVNHHLDTFLFRPIYTQISCNRKTGLDRVNKILLTVIKHKPNGTKSNENRFGSLKYSFDRIAELSFPAILDSSWYLCRSLAQSIRTRPTHHGISGGSFLALERVIGNGRHWVRPHWLAASGQLGRSRLMTSRDRVLATTFVPVF